MNVLKAEVRNTGTDLSNMLNNAIKPDKAWQGIEALINNFRQLDRTANIASQNFKGAAKWVSDGLSDIAAKAGLTEKEFAKLTERMLQTQVAKNTEKALRDIGQACNLTAKEMDELAKRMGVTQQKVDDHTQGLGRLKQGWAMVTAGVASAMYIYGQINRVISYAIDSYMEQERAENRLAMAMKNMGTYSQNAHDSLVQFANQLQETTAISDEAAIEVMALLKTFGMSDEYVRKTTLAVADLSVALGVDLQTAAKIMGKAFAGETGTLSRYGIIVDSTKVGVQKFDEVLKQVQGRFGGFAQDELSTYAGRWQHLKNRVGEAAEAVGKFLLDVAFGGPPINKQIEALQRYDEELEISDFNMTTLSHKTMPELAKEWDRQRAEIDALTGSVKAFNMVSDDTLKAQDKLAKELQKVKIDIAFFNKDDVEKQKALLKVSEEDYRKAGVAETEIAKLTSAKIVLLNLEKRDKILRSMKMTITDEEDSLLQETLMQQKSADREKAIWESTYGYEYKVAKEFIEKRRKAFEESMEAIEALSGAEPGGREAASRLTQQYQAKATIERIKMEADMYRDLSKSSTAYYDEQRKLIEDRATAARMAGVDEGAIIAWVADQRKKAWEESALKGDDFWEGLTASRDKYYREENKAGKLANDIFKDYISERNKAVSSFVDKFIEGQDLMVSAQKAAGDMMTNLAGDISKRMWAAGIDKIVQYIGAKIGQGSAEVAASGAAVAGVPGALSQIALYLGTAVAAMLAGRGMAKAFKAQGGWVSEHPMGGWINQGSGIRDDVYLGATGNIRHWGMGGEYVVNQRAAAQFAPLLEAMNKKYANGGPVGGPEDWRNVADALLAGSGGSFLHGFYKGGIWGAIAEAIAFNATAIPSMFAGKYAGNKFLGEGGWVDVGHGLFDIFKLPRLPFLPKFNIPGLPKFFQPNVVLDPEAGKAMLLDIARAPYEQVARDLLTPGKYFSEPLNVLGNNLSNLGRITREYFLPKFHEGGTVAQSGMASVEAGETIIPRGGMAPIQITLKLDGKVLSSYIYDQTKSGKKMIHPRGMATA